MTPPDDPIPLAPYTPLADPLNPTPMEHAPAPTIMTRQLPSDYYQDAADRGSTIVTLLGHFSFLLPFIPVLLLHLSHACVAPRPLGLASSLLGSLYFYFLGVDSL